MTKLILHVGLHKTATSSIQQFLWKNRDNLRSQNFLYPESGRDVRNNHHSFATKIGTNIPFLSAKADVLKFCNDVEKESNESNCSNIILSSEVLSQNQIYYPLLAYFTDFFDVKVIIYLKRQDLMKESVFNQIVWQSGFSDLIESEKRYEYDYCKHIEKWVTVFGEESLSVNVFEKEQLVMGDIVHDFCNKTGVDTSNLSGFDIRENTSRNKYFTELLRRVNMYSELSLVERRRKFKVIDRKKINSDKYGKYFQGWERRKSFVDQYNDSNSYIAKKYLKKKNGELFVSMPNENEDPCFDYFNEKLIDIDLIRLSMDYKFKLNKNSVPNH